MRPPAVGLDWNEVADVRVYEEFDIQSVIESQVENCQLQNDLSSFLICDVGSIVDQYNSWTTLLPNVQPSYVVGCNDDPTILKTLSKLGAKFNCINKGEIERALAAGVEASRVAFINPVKQTSHIKYCGKIHIPVIAFDSESELKKIKAHYPKAELVLQVATGMDPGASEMDWMRGCQPKMVGYLLHSASNMGLTVSGVSAVVGRPSRCSAVPVLERAVQVLREVYDTALSEGVKLKFIDLGNITWDWSVQNPNFTEVARSLQTLLNAEFSSCLDVELRAEVGDFLVSRALTLVTSVIAKRRLQSSGPTGVDGDVVDMTTATPEFCYYLNDGVYGAFSRLLTDTDIHISPAVYKVDEYSGKQYSTATLMGPTCDDLDCITACCKLPDLSVGDWIIFNNMGGVTASSSTQSHVSVYVIDKSHWSTLHGADKEDFLSPVNSLKSPDVCSITASSVLFTVIDPSLCDSNNNKAGSDREGWLDM